MCKWNSGVTGEQRVENCFGYIEVSCLRLCYGTLFGKVEKATSDIVRVVVSVKIRRWTALKQDIIQPFEPDCAFIIIITLIFIIIALISAQFLLWTVFPFPPP